MAVTDPKELFVLMLSDLRHGTERSNKILQELSEIAQEPEVVEALQARIFMSGHTLNTLDECFKIIGEKPVKVTGRLHEVFAEDFKRELAEIKSPETKRLFILAKAIRLAHLRMGGVRDADRGSRYDGPPWRRSPVGKLSGGQTHFRGAGASSHHLKGASASGSVAAQEQASSRHPGSALRAWS